MTKFTALTALLLISYGIHAADVSIDRQGRRVEIDGFLLEWNLSEARRWPASYWAWDAVNTADGLAGYFAAHNAQPCTVYTGEEAHIAPPLWTFTINAVNTGKSIIFTIPEQTKNENFTFDRSSFKSDGHYVAEWFVPWSFFEDDAARHTLTLNARNACGDTLPAITITANRPHSRPSEARSVYVMMALAGVVTLALIAIRRRGRR